MPEVRCYGGPKDGETVVVTDPPPECLRVPDPADSELIHEYYRVPCKREIAVDPLRSATENIHVAFWIYVVDDPDRFFFGIVMGRPIWLPYERPDTDLLPYFVELGLTNPPKGA